ncbi:MAG: YjgN family protein [Firmicutes bacterium]|nr:YjgN family protein [Bacillota bacterium]
MESKWIGNPLGFLGRALLLFPVIIGGLLTFGILFAWYNCMMKRFIINNTIVDGKQLRFDGRAMGLWIRSILWMLLTFITFGFYALLGFRARARAHWVASNTHFADAGTTVIVTQTVA